MYMCSYRAIYNLPSPTNVQAQDHEQDSNEHHVNASPLLSSDARQPAPESPRPFRNKEAKMVGLHGSSEEPVERPHVAAMEQASISHIGSCIHN